MEATIATPTAQKNATIKVYTDLLEELIEEPWGYQAVIDDSCERSTREFDNDYDPLDEIM